MKTAISIPDKIFKEVEKVAREYSVSRSELFTMAVNDFLEKVESKKLLDAINRAYSPEAPNEAVLRRAAKKYYRRRFMKEPFGD